MQANENPSPYQKLTPFEEINKSLNELILFFKIKTSPKACNKEEIFELIAAIDNRKKKIIKMIKKFREGK